MRKRSSEMRKKTPPKIHLFIKMYSKLEPILRRVYVPDVYVERVMYILDKEQRFGYVLVVFFFFLFTFFFPK